MDALQLSASSVQLGKNGSVTALGALERLGGSSASVLEDGGALELPASTAKETGSNELTHSFVADANDRSGLANCDAQRLGFRLHRTSLPYVLWGRKPPA